MCQRAKLTYPTTANSGPTHQNSGGKLSQGLGPLPVLKTFGQRAVLPVWRDSERKGDCPLGRASGLGDGVSGSDAPAFDMTVQNRRVHSSGLLLGLVHRF